jgi:hypothetical protein
VSKFIEEDILQTIWKAKQQQCRVSGDLSLSKVELPSDSVTFTKKLHRGLHLLASLLGVAD